MRGLKGKKKKEILLLPCRERHSRLFLGLKKAITNHYIEQFYQTLDGTLGTRMEREEELPPLLLLFCHLRRLLLGLVLEAGVYVSRLDLWQLTIAAP